MTYPLVPAVRGDFNRPDVNPIGGGFNVVWFSQGMQLVSQKVKIATVDAQNYWSADGAMYASDQECWCTIGALPATGQSLTVFVRITDTNTANFYGLSYVTGTGWKMLKNVAGGGNTFIGSTVVSPTPVAGDSFGVWVQNSLLSGWHRTAGGAETLLFNAVSDTGLPPQPGWIGFEISDAVGSLSKFGGGPLTGYQAGSAVGGAVGVSAVV